MRVSCPPVVRTSSLGAAPLPPPRFSPAREVYLAERTVSPHGTPRPRNAAFKAGLRYEKKVQDFLTKRFSVLYDRGPWFRFREARSASWRYCQPDGLLAYEDFLLIVEVKTRWCAEAWWQLRYLYAPVVQMVLRPRALGFCVVTRSFDPAITVPGPTTFVDDIEEIRRLPSEETGVFIWKG